MKLSDLKTGMHVIVREGDEYIVLKDTCLFDSYSFYGTYAKNILKALHGGAFTSLDNYNEDFTTINGIKNIDIVEVYTCNYPSAIFESVKDAPDVFTLIFAEQPIMTIKEAEEKFGIKILN